MKGGAYFTIQQNGQNQLSINVKMRLVADAPPPACEVEQIGWSVKRRGNVFKTAL